MKSKHLLLTLLLALLVPWAANAQTLTVYDDESATNRFVPIDGYNVDGTSIKSEYIMPAEELTAMNGKEITKMTLYLQTVGNKSWGNATFRVFMKEVQTTTISSFTGYSDATVVYVGGLDCLNEEMEITFTENYTYNGGNLLIGFYIITSGSYTGSYNDYKPLYYGETVTGASIGGTSATQQNFLPKTTFTYQNAASCPKPSGLAVNGLTATWNAGTASQWNLKYKKTSASTWTPVNGLTTASYPFSGLEAQADYEVQVQSDCGGGDLSEWTSSVNFTAPCDAITTFPWSEDFEDFTANTVPECWDNSTSTSSDATANPHYIWGVYSYNSNKMLRMYNFYAHTGTALINSQPITLPATGEYELSFDYAHNATCGAFLVKISENGGEFVQKGSYTKGNGSSSTDPGEFTQADPISLAAYAGKTIIVQFYANANYGSGAIFVDNVKIALPPTCQKPTDLECTGTTATKATLRWTNGAASQTAWQICLNGDEDHLISANSNPFTISTGLTPATTYTAKVRAYCSETDQSEWSNTISFTTDCPDSYPLDYTCGFEGPNTTTNPLPLCWTRMGSHTTIPNVSTNQHHGEGTRSLYFYKSSSTTYNNEIAALPAIDAEMNTVRVVFYGKLSSASTDGTINVGYVTSLTDATTFQSVETVTLTTDWEKYTISFGNVGNVSGNIAFQALYSTAYAYIYIDDVLVEEIPSCLEPADLAEVPNTATSNSVRFGWTAVNNENTWKVQYKKSDATEWTTVAEPVTTNPYTLPGLDHSSTYQVRVAAWCTPSNPEGISGYCEPITVHTECEAITSFPWNETFESYAAGNFSDQCWVNEHISGEGTSIFRVYTYSIGTNNTHMLQLPDQSLGTLTKLRLPEMTLPDNNYQFVIDVYRSSSYSDKTGEGIRVFVSTDGEITGATELAFIPRYYNFASGIIPAEPTGDQWYTYELPIGISGTCYIILRGENQYGTSTYMDNLTVEEIPACSRPSALACTAKTAHTATFSWTNGAEGQNAWQIAYSTTADFDPSTVTPVDVTTNPATISGLTVGTTYYAYVRANCDTDGYSPWSRKSCTFTTVASGANPPTGLAVDHATITSSQATANWTGVATNDYHASYDLYYALATVTEVPAEPAAPNLIAGITATSQVISDLDPETDYKVWVRDNCGADGYSAWTSSVTFTTSSACETPDGLDKSNVTNESATITWNTYGLTTFNLRYRTGTEEWEVKKIVACPYTIEGLTGNITYEVQVQATCNTDEWSSVFNFTTACDAVTTFPWGEDFESYPATTSSYNSSNHDNDLVDNCWVNEHISGDGTRLFQVSSYSYTTGNTTKKLVLPDMSNGTMTKLCLPAMSLPNANYQFAIDVFRNASTENYGEGIRVFVSTNGEIEGATELAFISRSYTTTDGGLIPAENTSGWYTYELPIGISGTCYIILRGESKYGSSTYMDNFIVEEIPTCARPSGLAKSDVTNYSATLTWTPGEEGQTHWQIAYKNTSFNPNAIGFDLSTVTTLDIEANNTYTFNHTLTPNTTYYMYVRANCGDAVNPNYSKWCATGVNFTTKVATPAPSSFTASNPGPDCVDLVWNAGGGENESWDLYYVASETNPTETPDDDTEPLKTVSTLPTAQAPYTLTGLDDETKYYIWVRANYGTDGTSSWVGPRNFTTLEACPAPTSIAAGNLTQNTADLTWTGYSDSYNIKYNMGAYYDFFEGFENGLGSWTFISMNAVNGMGGSGTYPAGIYSAAAHNDSYGFRFSSYTQKGDSETYDQYLVSPELTVSGELKFYFKKGSTSTESLYVGYSTTTNDLGDVSAWTWTEDLEPTQTWQDHTLALPNDVKYIAFHYFGNYTYYVFIDDITIGEQHPAGASVDVTDHPTECAYTLTGLTAGRTYEVQIQGVCGGTAGDWSETYSFTTYGNNTKVFTTAGDWSTASNWAPVGAPIATDNVIIRANVTIPKSTVATANNITFEGTPTPKITIKDGGQLIHRNSGVTATLEKEITGYSSQRDHYYLLGVPQDAYDGTVDPEDVQNMLENEYDLYSFDGSQLEQEWRNYKVNGQQFDLEGGVGYLYANSENVTLSVETTLQPAQDYVLANYYYALSYSDGSTNPFNGWNLVSNPWTFPGYMYVYDEDNDEIISQDFYRMGENGIEAEASTGAVAPWEAVFVEATAEDLVALVTFEPLNLESRALNLVISQNSATIDNARIRFGQGRGLKKFQLNQNHTKVFIPQDNNNYAVVYSEENVGEMPVNFKAEKNGSYTLSFTTEEVTFSYLHLIDNLTGADVDLLETPAYTFDARTSDYASRFKLVFATGNSTEDNFAYFNNGSLVINNDGNATVQVVDVMGRVLSSETINGSANINVNAAAGVYVIRLINGENVKTQKIVVR